MKLAEIYSEDARRALGAVGLWAGVRSYDDAAKAWLARSGHYLDAPPPGALLAISVEPMTRGLFGPVPSGELLGLALLGRPIARMLPQDSTWAELTRFVLVPDLPHGTASLALRVAVEVWCARPRSVAMISYHDRTRHSGCIYRKAGFRKDGVTRANGRRGSWATRAGREQAASSEVESKRRWRIDVADVCAAISARAISHSTP